MAEQSEYARALVTSAAIGATPKVPIIEPVLPIMDEWSREIIINTCFEIKKKEGNPEGEPVIVCKYPDILVCASVGISHLLGLNNLTWEQGMSLQFDFEGLVLQSLLDKYNRNPEAMNALRAIEFCVSQHIKGKSMGGKTQDFLVRYTGSDRRLRIMRGEEEGRT